MRRIAVLCDTHLTSPDQHSGSLWPRQMNKLPPERAKKLYEQIRQSIDEANSDTYEFLTAHRPWDAIIHLGDLTGGWQERGLTDASVIDLAEKHLAAWRNICPVHFCAGGHDIGYAHRGSLDEGGINFASISVCQNLFGNLWWQEKYEGCLLVGICSPLAGYRSLDDNLTELKGQQEQFLSTFGHNILQPWILFAHDPFLPKEVIENLTGTDRAKSCRAFLHGHSHNPRYRKLFRALGFLTGNTLLRHSHACPSVAPLWWQGRGITELTIDRKWVLIKNHILAPPASSVRPLTASFLRCLWWILRPT